MKAALIVAAAALTVTTATVAATAAATDGRTSIARVTLRLADGTEIGTVRFRDRRDTAEP